MSISAFPTVLPKDWDSVNEGMTLRDYFAAQALPALIALYCNTEAPREITKRSYRMADLMLEARDE
jgi:hypothetical protein